MSGGKACIKSKGLSLNQEISVLAVLNNSVSDYGAVLKGNNLKKNLVSHCRCQLLGRVLPGNRNKNTSRKILSSAVFVITGLNPKRQIAV